jgi:hypothetical protein
MFSLAVKLGISVPSVSGIRCPWSADFTGMGMLFTETLKPDSVPFHISFKR